jgi:integrase
MNLGVLLMSNSGLVPSHDTTTVSIGEVADRVAASYVLRDYHKRLAGNTKRRQSDDLALFASYLCLAGIQVSGQELMEDIMSWASITHGIVKAFIRYQEQEGYAIGSINVRLATVKRYCSLAAEAHSLDESVAGLISRVKGYSHKDGRNLDKERPIVRKGTKKAEPVQLSKEQTAQIKEQPDTPQGRRDILLLCLLFDHGLRCGEIAGLTLQCINLNEETLTFYREKVDMTQIHSLTKDTRMALRRYLDCVQLLPGESLLQGSRKGGGRLLGRMSERAITARVNVLGERIGVQGLSAHDGRHAWATSAIRGGTDLKSLQDAGGWKSIAMPARYAASQQIANKGVKLD